MKNNKGFTLVELIAVVTIIALLIGLSATVFINVQKNVLEKSYDNTVSYIETRAAKFASDTGIITVSIEDLIKAGYLKPDDENYIYDPRDNSIMNCYIINMTREGNGYSAKLSNVNNIDENNNCKDYEQKAEVLIDVFDESKKNLIKYEVGKWYNQNLVLRVREDGIYYWEGNDGFSSTEKEITVSTDTVKNTVYRVKLTKTEEGKEVVGTRNIAIKIDKQAPVVNNISYNKLYSEKKVLKVEASDGINGSGIADTLIFKTADAVTNCNFDFKKYENITEVSEEGILYACAKDRAGNVSNLYSIDVKNIGKAPTDLKIVADDNIESGNVHVKTPFKLNFSAKSDAGEITYYYYTSKDSKVKKGNSVDIKDITVGTDYIVKACNFVGCSEEKKYTVITDVAPSKPTYKITDGKIIDGLFGNSITFELHSESNGGTGPVYYYGKKSAYSSSTDKLSSNILTIYSSGNYFIKACNKTGQLCSEEVLLELQQDKQPDRPVIKADDNVSSGYAHSSSFKLNFSVPNYEGSALTYYYKIYDGIVNARGDLEIKEDGFVGFRQEQIINSMQGNDIFFGLNVGNKIVGVVACTKTGRCSGISYYDINPDDGDPMILSIKDESASKNERYPVKLTIEALDNDTAIVAYKLYPISKDPNDVEFIPINDGKKEVIIETAVSYEEADEYCVQVKDAAGNVSYGSGYDCVDLKGPTVFNLSVSYACTGYDDDVIVSNLNFQVIDADSWFSAGVNVESDGRYYDYYFTYSLTSVSGGIPNTNYAGIYRPNYLGERSGVMTCNKNVYFWIQAFDKKRNYIWKRGTRMKWCNCKSGEQTKENACDNINKNFSTNYAWCSSSTTCNMYQNSILWWHAPSSSAKQCLVNKNQSLGTSLGKTISFDNGTWYVYTGANMELYSAFCGYTSLNNYKDINLNDFDWSNSDKDECFSK